MDVVAGIGVFGGAVALCPVFGLITHAYQNFVPVVPYPGTGVVVTRQYKAGIPVDDHVFKILGPSKAGIGQFEDFLAPGSVIHQFGQETGNVETHLFVEKAGLIRNFHHSVQFVYHSVTGFDVLIDAFGCQKGAGVFDDGVVAGFGIENNSAFGFTILEQCVGVHGFNDFVTVSEAVAPGVVFEIFFVINPVEAVVGYVAVQAALGIVDGQGWIAVCLVVAPLLQVVEAVNAGQPGVGAVAFGKNGKLIIAGNDNFSPGFYTVIGVFGLVFGFVHQAGNAGFFERLVEDAEALFETLCFKFLVYRGCIGQHKRIGQMNHTVAQFHIPHQQAGHTVDHYIAQRIVAHLQLVVDHIIGTQARRGEIDRLYGVVFDELVQYDVFERVDGEIFEAAKLGIGKKVSDSLVGRGETGVFPIRFEHAHHFCLVQDFGEFLENSVVFEKLSYGFQLFGVNVFSGIEKTGFQPGQQGKAQDQYNYG